MAIDVIWVRRISACAVTMFRIRMTGDWESRGQPAKPGLPGKWLLKRCVRVCLSLLLIRSSGRLNSSSLAVRTGSIYLYSQDVDRALQVYAVDRLVVHPSFNASGGSVVGDMALVRLARPLIMTDSVRPVCLHRDAVSDARSGSARYGVCVVAGWAPSRAPSSCLYLIVIIIIYWHNKKWRRLNKIGLHF